METSKERSAFYGAFIYSWFDGPEEGAALNRARIPVTFQPVVTARKGQTAFLLSPLSPSLYEHLVRRYGQPPENPVAGIVMDPIVSDPNVDEVVREMRSANQGSVVFCRDDNQLSFLDEVRLPDHLARKLVELERPERLIDELLAKDH